MDRLGEDRHSRLFEGLAESGMGVHGATEVLAARVVPVKNHTRTAREKSGLEPHGRKTGAPRLEHICALKNDLNVI